jgi:integrase
MQPWSNQFELKKEKIPGINELILKAEHITDIRTRALFILAYLTAGRIQEIVRSRGFDLKRKCPKCQSKEIVKINNQLTCNSCHLVFKARESYCYKSPNGNNRPSITKVNISVVNKNNRRVLLINIRNEKSKEIKNKEIPIPLDRVENIAFYNMLIGYLNTLEINDELFPFNYQRANDLLEETGFNPHWIRHLRATHLVTVYDFNEQELIKYMGWTDSRPARFYMQLKWSDLLNKL